jgi:hypothetical protein
VSTTIDAFSLHDALYKSCLLNYNFQYILYNGNHLVQPIRDILFAQPGAPVEELRWRLLRFLFREATVNYPENGPYVLDWVEGNEEDVGPKRTDPPAVMYAKVGNRAGMSGFRSLVPARVLGLFSLFVAGSGSGGYLESMSPAKSHFFLPSEFAAVRAYFLRSVSAALGYIAPSAHEGFVKKLANMEWSPAPAPA